MIVGRVGSRRCFGSQPMQKATASPPSLPSGLPRSTTPPTGEGARPPPTSTVEIDDPGEGAPVRKPTWYCLASPRFESHEPTAGGVGLLVAKYVKPATVSGELTTFSPTAISKNQPFLVTSPL